MRHALRPLVVTLIVSGAVVLAGLGLRAQSTSRFVGTWVLDLEQSTFEPAEFQPDSKTVVLEMVGNAIRQDSQTWRGEGRGALREATYTAALDGSEVVIAETGVRLSVRQIDANIIERSATGDDGAMETSMWKVSPDGATLTIMAEGVGPFGAKYRSTQVFTRDLSD